MASADRRTRLVKRVAGLPGWVVFGFGAAAMVVGALLVARPFTSLTLLVVLLAVAALIAGIGALVELFDRTGRRRVLAVVMAVGWLIAAGVILIVPTLTLVVLTLVVGIGLIIHGVTRMVTRRSGTRRLVDVMVGVAAVALGLVALLWPDVTVFVTAAVFGIHVIVLGIELIAGRLRPVRQPGPRSAPGWRRTVLAAAAMVAAVSLLFLGVRWSIGPQPDDFYSVPASAPATPGVLLRSEPFEHASVPADAVAWRILYTTTRTDPEPAVASAIVVLPAATGEYPVIAWAHGTTGVAQRCAPSLLAEPFAAGAMPELAPMLAQGWAVVATDYTGLGTVGPHPLPHRPG